MCYNQNNHATVVVGVVLLKIDENKRNILASKSMREER